MSKDNFKPLDTFQEYPQDQMQTRAREFQEMLARRRTIRDFSDRPVPREIIEDCLLAAMTAPSGANMQPWKFIVVEDAETKSKIREAAEKEEKLFYSERATPEWLAALAPLGTDEHKPYLEVAPYLIAIFVERYGILPDGRHVKHYYAQESVGIATGMLIAAIHNAGLASLTHTPSPMGFLSEVLERPENEKAFLLLVVGYPSEDATVPDITKDPLEKRVVFVD